MYCKHVGRGCSCTIWDKNSGRATLQSTLELVLCGKRGHAGAEMVTELSNVFYILTGIAYNRECSAKPFQHGLSG